jgi:zinc transport system ATP-binding protein
MEITFQVLNVAEIEHLTVQYPDVKALDDVSFSVNKGDFLGIIGPNGAGKSTLFASMLGLNTKYKGVIKFFGKDIRKSKEYLKEIGYVPQKPIFEKNFPATVNDVIRMGLRQESDASKIDEILQQLWIHELSKKRIGELSGGQQQRVFIAKALVNNPKLLILDEPVTGIDQQSIELFYSILRELNSKQKITIIWSSHDLDAVNKLANHVACLNRTLFFHGESVEFFENDELVKQYSEASMQEHMHQH